MMSFNPVCFTIKDAIIPARPTECHKGTFGKVAIIAGSMPYPGAAFLALNSARAALMSGAGYAVLCIPKSLWNAYASRVENEVLHTLPDVNGALEFSPTALDDAVQGAKAVVVGPGLVCDNLKDVVLHLIKSVKVPLVLDAGALNALTGINNPFDGATDVIITPHLGEFARLTGKSISDINPAFDAWKYAKEHKITVHLKGATSVTAYPDGRVITTAEGSPALAKAGSGDVLSGIMGAMLAQGVQNPVPTAAVLHGLAGKIAAETYGDSGVMGSDVIDGIAKSLARLCK